MILLHAIKMDAGVNGVYCIPLIVVQIVDAEIVTGATVKELQNHALRKRRSTQRK